MTTTKPCVGLSEPLARPYGNIRFFRPGHSAPFNCSHFVVQPSEATSVDQHEAEEMWIVVSGSGTLFFDGEAYPVVAKDCLHFATRKTHQVNNTGSVELVIISIWWNNVG